MRKIFVFALISLLLFSCKSTDQSAAIKTNFDSETVKTVSQMSIREKIGQVLLVNFRFFDVNEWNFPHGDLIEYEDTNGNKYDVVAVDRVNNTIITAIKKYHIGNVILFAENLNDISKAAVLISDLQMIAKKNNNLPLIISVDQEGGRVNRIFQTAVFPPAKEIGNTKDSKNAYIEGQYLGMQLSALGINLDFAPVCDVDSNPKNPVIGDRSFSKDPVIAARFACELQKGLKSQKVIPCAKHFPGHGDTDVDSHIGLPLVNRTKSQWKKLEAVPFRMNINNNIPVIMSAHIQYPGLDNTRITADKTGKSIIRPATLSKKILTDILRNELKFNGVICTDAMDMKAISKNFTESMAVIEALNAGADMICNPISITTSKDLIRLENMYRQIVSALSSGKLSQERLDNAVLRIVQLKKDYGILNKDYHSITKNEINRIYTTLKLPEYYSFIEQIK